MRRIFGSRNKGESDVEVDEQVASSREVGGVPDPTQPDQGSTTGTTPNGEFVGRVAGQDVGYAGETGAERRAEAARQDRAAGERDDLDTEEKGPAAS